MKAVLKLLAATVLLSSVTACVVVPPHVEYVGPRVAVVPYYSNGAYPVYRQPYYGEPMRPHHHDWDRHW